MTTSTYSGGCHCGSVKFRVSAEPIDVSVCNCSMCSMKGFVHWIVKPEQFELLSGADDLSVYTFNTGIAKHTFCKHCGIHSFYTPRSDPDKVDVNARCVPGLDLNALKVRTFDGQHWEKAFAER